MSPIPPKIRHILEHMPRMKRCEFYGDCDGRIQFHHVWIYAGKQIQEVWAIVAVCERHHGMVKTDRNIREELERRSLDYSVDDELLKYPKVNWEQKRKYLFSKI